MTYARFDPASDAHSAGFSVPALFRAVTRDDVAAADGTVYRGVSVAHFPATYAPPIGFDPLPFDPPPKSRDRVVRANGEVWIVDTVEVQTIATRYRCRVVKAK